ncbi:MAG: VWA domain-containing protein [Acidobacteriia bacterium]|nr:VWA domain-containing protein [Terriglobia bacterium]
MRASHFSILVVLVATLALPQADSGRGQRAAFSSETNLVLVPVVVLDHGHPVSHLTRDDFQVQENGRGQKVAAFEEVVAQAAPVQRVTPPTNTFSNQVMEHTPRKMEIIVLDLLNTPFDDRVQARRGILDFLSKTVEKNALIAVLTIGRGGPRIIHDFTSDTAILTAAIGKLQGELSVADTRTSRVDEEGVLLAKLFERDFSRSSQSTDSSHATLADDDIVTAYAAVAQAAEAKVDIGRQNDAALATLLNFQEVAHYFSAVQGRKALIWASAGFPASFANVTGAASRGPTPDDWQRTMRLLQDANITIYPLDVTGLVTNVAANYKDYVPPIAPGPQTSGTVPEKSRALEAVAAGVYSDPVVAKHAAMLRIAEMTGGEAYYNRNDVSGLFARADQDETQFYLVSYYSSDSSTVGWRKIAVKVRRKGVQVRHRSGYYFDLTLRDPEEAQLLDERMALDSSLPFTGLPLSGTWGKIELEKGTRKVYFSLFVPPGKTQVESSKGDHISMDFLTVVRTREGKEVASIGQGVNQGVDQEAVTRIDSGGVTYLNYIRLLPGEYTAKFVVRDNLTGSIGSLTAPLKVD